MNPLAGRFPFAWTFALLVVLIPVGTLAGQARSSMEVSAVVVRGDDSAASTTALIARIETADGHTVATPAIDGDAQCEAVGNTVVVNDGLASCRWEPESRTYLVTIQY